MYTAHDTAYGAIGGSLLHFESRNEKEPPGNKSGEGSNTIAESFIFGRFAVVKRCIRTFDSKENSIVEAQSPLWTHLRSLKIHKSKNHSLIAMRIHPRIPVF
ncbi:hypothetical protein Naga_101200g2 [Nannochloropsis gaditana]|uniref:Uncharacterized protein n=1 Tax=Nannochloropsis gaditana TaxID=72520 RepID=W7TVY4_9STRA|nr:hypothetical protein Naga_101200g2 [Nannochloropsis gaditana]